MCRTIRCRDQQPCSGVAVGWHVDMLFITQNNREDSGLSGADRSDLPSVVGAEPDPRRPRVCCALWTGLRPPAAAPAAAPRSPRARAAARPACATPCAQDRLFRAAGARVAHPARSKRAKRRTHPYDQITPTAAPRRAANIYPRLPPKQGLELGDEVAPRSACGPPRRTTPHSVASCGRGGALGRRAQPSLDGTKTRI